MPLESNLYHELRDRLRAEFPEARREIENAAVRVFRGALSSDSCDVVWRTFGDKPLYSAMRADGLGDRYSFMWRSGYFPNAATMASDAWEISYKRKPDTSWNNDANWVLVGDAALEFRRTAQSAMDMGELGVVRRPQVSKQRLWNMRRIACKVAAMASAEGAADTNPIALKQSELQRATDVAAFHAIGQQAVGLLDCGLTTVFHGFTDLGFDAVKPDMHVARSLCYFRNIDSELGVTQPVHFLRHDGRKAHVVTEGVRLARTVRPLPEFKGFACREVDVVLLWASKTRLIYRYQR